MIDQINQLIAINLQLFYTAVEGQLKLKDFKDYDGNQISGAKMLADIMQQKELIQPHLKEPYTYELTEFGRSICLHGGWEKHLEKLSKLSLALEQQTKPILNQQKKRIPTLILTAAILVIAIILIWIL